MIAVILAGGMAKRLRPLTNDIPKCLLKVGKESILTRYLTLLEKAKIQKTIIVHGFNAEAVEKEVGLYKGKMVIECVLNAEYRTTAPIEGFLLTERVVQDDFLLLNADIYFSEKILTLLIEYQGSCIGIDTKAHYIKDEMFVNFDNQKRVTNISKSLEKRDSNQGKSVQIAKFLIQDKNDLFKRAREIAGKEGVLYPAQAYDVLIKKKRFYAIDVDGEFTHELDTVADYEALMHILKG